jgi:uncharacterized membrane protein
MLWARVGGDMMDLALLRRASRSERADGTRVAAAMAAVVGVTLLDMRAARQASVAVVRKALGGAVEHKAITINRTPEEVFEKWRALEDPTEIIEERANELITLERGSVYFKAAPGSRGTEVRVDAREGAPDLRHMKQLIELGEIVRSGGEEKMR